MPLTSLHMPLHACCSWLSCSSLPDGALTMTEDYINAPPVCVRTGQELRAVITEALQVLGTGSQELQLLAAEAMQELVAAALAGVGI